MLQSSLKRMTKNRLILLNFFNLPLFCPFFKSLKNGGLHKVLILQAFLRPPYLILNAPDRNFYVILFFCESALKSAYFLRFSNCNLKIIVSEFQKSAPFLPLIYTLFVNLRLIHPAPLFNLPHFTPFISFSSTMVYTPLSLITPTTLPARPGLFLMLSAATVVFTL